ncbi:hypothetical protein GCM10012275_27020 [Longimycelium tulufanense]|uniref:Methyltransferase domain-containing protein n=1 Tax=Longimycelium tulufanense TaxID=907463 RepID=A0A8J3C8I0_9PSEU|nr:methyltransferase [Longimycelium tulufanense]GGM54493.1 hypothetical protein GCM10012275_27020 [Longimycelium tulufanense]
MTTQASGFGSAPLAGGPFPAAPGLANADVAFPPLAASAFPVVADRWERLVAMGSTTFPADQVWTALTEPEHVRHWLAVCRGSWAKRDAESMLDFEDGEFFWCRTLHSTPPTMARPGTLRYLWRWLGIGPATEVTWTIAPSESGTTITVVEEAQNPASDWRSWNGMGWPGIIDQLSGYLRTGASWRWPWRRMGPYVQIPLPAAPFEAWDALTSPAAVKHWMGRSAGSLSPGDEMTLVMGDASGTALLRVTRAVDAGQEFPSYLPYLEFELRRRSWTAALGGRMWVEPAGLGACVLHVFHHNWEALGLADPLPERRILTNFWASAAARAQLLFRQQGSPGGPHGWSVAAADPAEQGGAATPQGMPGHGGAGPAIDVRAAMAFAGRVMGDLSGAMVSLMAVLGVRLGIFAALAGGPANSAELARRTGLAERYLREWLWCLHSANYLQATPDGRFSLPLEHAGVLARTDSPFSLTGGHRLFAAMATMLDPITEAFRTGEGVAHGRYPEEFAAAMEQMSATWVDHMLVDQWLPAVDGLTERLAAGGFVADVGCGSGRALIRMAERFPSARFVGYDLHEPNLERAREAADRSGVADRVHFERADAAEALAAPTDLVTMLDVLHDAPDPEATLRAARVAVAESGGVVLVLESSGADDARDNTGAPASILYATSTLYCVPTALADGAPALGTFGLPAREMTRLADRAGFREVREFPVQSPFNALYVLRL